jgi:phosphoribosylformylglycinamidine synthase
VKKARVYVTLKKTVLDPQGQTVARALNHLGYSSVTGARVGKIIELDLEDAATEDEVREMAARLLANPVIEDFTVEFEE